jgi:hypothetical protein
MGERVIQFRIRLAHKSKAELPHRNRQSPFPPKLALLGMLPNHIPGSRVYHPHPAGRTAADKFLGLGDGPANVAPAVARVVKPSCAGWRVEDAIHGPVHKNPARLR